MKAFRQFPAYLILTFTAAAMVSAPLIAAPKKEKSKKATKEATKPATSEVDQSVEIYLSAQMNLLSILDRYASALAGAVDQASAQQAVMNIDGITKEIIIAGENLVKLGRPKPEVEARLMKHPDLLAASRMVADHTKSAVAGITSNVEVKPVLSPAVQQFQAALNRLQQTAEDPQAPGSATAAAPGAIPPPSPDSGAPSPAANPFAGAPPAQSAPIPPPSPEPAPAPATAAAGK